MAIQLGVAEEQIRKAFQSFKGVKRRCEKKAEIQEILLLDDYAHHPTEIRSTLKAVRSQIEERRLIAIFQPHRYSRVKESMQEIEKAFKSADQLIITEIYGAGESPIPEISHEMLIAKLRADFSEVQMVPRKELASFLARSLRPHDVAISLGAGDITEVHRELEEEWKKEGPSKLKVGMIFGGASSEHEISLLSASNIEPHLMRSHYDLKKFFISKKGDWSCGNSAKDNQLPLNEETLSQLFDCDLLFPVLHGPFGEDGTIQGFFELLGKPYVGCDYRSSAISMDKELTKELIIRGGIRTASFIAFTFLEWREQSDALLCRIEQKLKYPLFVKPIHLGSSIGVSKALTREELQLAIDQAFEFDGKVLVEEGIEGREIEFALLGNEKARAFPPGEILTEGRVYDYKAKYSEQGFPVTSSANLSPQLSEEGCKLAERAYSLIGCSGMARIDFFLDKEGLFWFNEVNPIPGFTKGSLYPQICMAQGLSFPKLIDRLVILALDRARSKQRGKNDPF